MIIGEFKKEFQEKKLKNWVSKYHLFFIYMIFKLQLEEFFLIKNSRFSKSY